ncbi:glycosyltransferase family 39 protein [Streptomyces halobius]|uniref:Glycosyltransferase family 39 protein n=1 Tax=Streptomyces halobius TaxID=2879846 RepID=A0ABY4MAK9_9ACTN|nr:glycosyltransferase family 39 protein [Streptomyces halobius]UQA94805.1 glycosyltransferase family 39 protein [Streptomyces halobius]
MVLVPSTLMLFLGAWGIRRQDAIWRDEVVTYDMAHRALADLWPTLLHVDVVHGLYYALMHCWFAVYDATFGGVLGDTIGLRLPSVAAMTAAAAGVALLGQRLVGRRAGLFAGVAFALIPVVQQYAQEGRSYAMVCALVVWSTYLLVVAAARPRRKLWVGYAALMLFACLLHEFAVLALPAHGAAVVVARLPRRVRRSWALASVGVLAGLAPLAVFSTRQSAQIGWLMWPDPVQLLTFTVLAVLGVAAARVPVRSRGPVGLRAIGIPLLLLPTLLLFLLSYAEPAYVDRYVLYYVTGFALLAGAALARLLRPAGERGQTRGRRLRRTAAVALVVAALLPVNVHLRSPDSRVDDASAVARAVREVAEPGDGLLFMPSRRRIWRAAHPRDFRGLTDLALARSPVESHSLYGTERSGDAIRDRMLTARRIIVAGDPDGQPADDNDQEIAKRATLWDSFESCTSREVRGARITVYARPGECGG